MTERLSNPAQARFERRRAASESALSSCELFRCTVGSRAWGLADAGSDTDTRGVFLWPFSWTHALRKQPNNWVSADGSHTRWEFGVVIERALRADPNTLEMLFVNSHEVLHPLGQALLDARQAFVSQEIYGAFGRYALAQSKKLRQSLRLAQHRALVLDWLRDDDALQLDPLAARLAAACFEDTSSASVLRAKEALKQLYRSMHGRGLIAGCSLEHLRAYARSDAPALELPRELRPKNAYNLLRIIKCASHWLRTGEPIIETRGELRERLMAIKKGEVELERALAWTDAASEELEAARADSVLPEAPDLARAEELLLRARSFAAKSWLDAEAGPWGRDAPAPLELA